MDKTTLNYNNFVNKYTTTIRTCVSHNNVILLELLVAVFAGVALVVNWCVRTSDDAIGWFFVH